MEQFTDHQLVGRYLKGDERSFDILVERYLNSIHRFVMGYVKDSQAAQDVTQEVFLKLLKHIKRVDARKSFSSWMYTIAKNTALDFLKKKKSIAFSQFTQPDGNNVLIDTLADRSQSALGSAQSQELHKTMLGAISNLSSKYHQVLMLYYYHYLNFREIAAVLKQPINTIKSRHRRAIVLLKKELDHRIA